MDTNLRSDNISLQFEFSALAGYDVVNELWQTARKTAVEPGQSSHPDYASFADECLFCARIVTNPPSTAAQDQNMHSSASLGDPEEFMHDPIIAPISPPPPSDSIVGLVYLHAGPANLQGGEVNIGVVTKPDMQRRGYAREAVQLALRWAFEELKFHRVQAAILDTPHKDRALRLFIGAGFMHEGTKRRAVYQPEGEGMAGVWMDVTYLAMLDTEWVLKSAWMQNNNLLQPPIASVWDEMFTRHAREREELAHWEEKHGRLRKTSSTETLRDRARDAAQDMAYLTDDASSVCTSSASSPKLNVIVSWEEDMVDDFDPDLPRHPSWEEVIETSLAARRHRQWLETTSLGPSPHGRMLALPSIPSTTGRFSEGNALSPLTIPTPSTPGSTPPPFSSTPPPHSPSPSPAPSGIEEQHDWLLEGDPFVTTHRTHADPGPSNLRTRSRSSSLSSSSTDWSDAHSSVGASVSSWDVVSESEASDHSPPWEA